METNQSWKANAKSYNNSIRSRWYQRHSNSYFIIHGGTVQKRSNFHGKGFKTKTVDRAFGQLSDQKHQLRPKRPKPATTNNNTKNSSSSIQTSQHYSIQIYTIHYGSQYHIRNITLSIQNIRFYYNIISN